MNALATLFFDRAIIIFPYFMEAYFNKAVAYQKKLDVGNMIKAYRKVIEIGDPRDAQVKQAWIENLANQHSGRLF